jgi:hypothetical protein
MKTRLDVDEIAEGRVWTTHPPEKRTYIVCFRPASVECFLVCVAYASRFVDARITALN